MHTQYETQKVATEQIDHYWNIDEKDRDLCKKLYQTNLWSY